MNASKDMRLGVILGTVRAFDEDTFLIGVLLNVFRMVLLNVFRIGLCKHMEGTGDSVFHGVEEDEEEFFVGLVEILELVVIEDVGHVEFKVLELLAQVVNPALQVTQQVPVLRRDLALGLGFTNEWIDRRGN
jgi:hypothetical protein